MQAAARDRDQTPGEELANALSHGLAFLLALAAIPVLVYGALQRGDGAAGAWVQVPLPSTPSVA